MSVPSPAPPAPAAPGTPAGALPPNHGPWLLGLGAGSGVTVLLGIPAAMLFPPFAILILPALAGGVIAAALAHGQRKEMAAGTRSKTNAELVAAAHVVGIIAASIAAAAFVIGCGLSCAADLLKLLLDFQRLRMQG